LTVVLSQAYGIEFVSELGPLKVPSKETDPRIPEPYASNIFYYPQYDYLRQKVSSPNTTFKFCEIRPDVIVGFVPQNNFMNLAQALGLFLSFYKSIHGEGAPVPFPGPKYHTELAGRELRDGEAGEQENTAWTAKRTDTSQDILAKFHLFASMHSDAVHTRAFNVADGIPEVVSWEVVWPGICAYFGLKGVPPDGSMRSFADWMKERKGEWAEWEEKMGLKKGALDGTGWEFMDAVMGVSSGGKSVDRQYDLSACREVGFHEKVDTVEGYRVAFDRKYYFPNLRL
jgi:hypothetical protein